MKNYQIKLLTPGIVVQLPTNDAVIRTPYTFFVVESKLELIKAMIRIRGIANYEINEIDEVPGATSIDLPKIQMKRPSSKIDLNQKLRGPGSPSF